MVARALVLFGVALAAIGAAFGRWLLLGIPVILGVGYGAWVDLSGTLHQQDSPVLSLVVFAEVVMATSVYARRRLAPPSPSR